MYKQLMGLWLICCCLAGISQPLRAAESLHVVTSIKPLALIARDLLGPQAEIEYLVPAGADPHHYALKVSDRMALANADLVLWIGPDMERFLSAVVDQLPGDRVISAQSLALEWPEQADPSDITGAQDHDHTSDAHDHNSKGMQGIYRDPHLWLNPQNAMVIERALAQWLTVRRGVDSQAALSASLQRLSQLDRQLGDRLRQLGRFRYAVYHDGYGHFIAHYGLARPLVISPSSTQAPGARHLLAIQNGLLGAACLLVEPSHNNQLTKQLSVASGVAVEQVDLLGSKAEVESYEALLQEVAEAFVRCSQQGQQ